SANEHALAFQVVGGLDVRCVVHEDILQAELAVGIGGDGDVGVVAFALRLHQATEASVPGVDGVRAREVADFELEAFDLHAAVDERHVGIDIWLAEGQTHLGIRHITLLRYPYLMSSHSWRLNISVDLGGPGKSNSTFRNTEECASSAGLS